MELDELLEEIYDTEYNYKAFGSTLYAIRLLELYNILEEHSDTTEQSSEE